jgi:hypothetical protein
MFAKLAFRFHNEHERQRLSLSRTDGILRGNFMVDLRNGFTSGFSEDLLAEIREKGLQDGILFVANNLVRLGTLTKRQVADVTGLSQEEIQKIEYTIGKSCASEEGARTSEDAPQTTDDNR